MKVSLQFKQKADPGILHGEAIVEFEFKIANALEALQKLQQANIPGLIAAALAEEVTRHD